MKDEDVKFALKALANSIADLAEKQSYILNLLAHKLPELTDAEKTKLAQSAQSGIASAEVIKRATSSF